MTDPNQNDPQKNPGNWNPNSGGWNQNPYGSQPPLYGQPGQPGQAPMYGAPGQPGQPGQSGGGNGGSGKLVAIIVGALVIVIIIAVVAIFALRGDDDDDNDTASDNSTSSAPLDDSLGDTGGSDSTDDAYGSDDSSGTGGDGSLPSQWSGIVPASVEEYLTECFDTSFNMNDVESSEQSEVDGTSCYLDGPAPLSGQQVDILAEDARIIYLRDALNGDVPGASGTVFDQSGSVTVGISDVESSGPTLFYLDSDSSVSVEIIEFNDENEARDAARELGLL